MKKILLLLLCTLLFTMCKSAKTVAKAPEKAAAEVLYRDDFKSAGDAEKAALLKELKAVKANYSVLVFTHNFKGEKITVTNASKKLYSGYPISDPKTGFAATARIDNSADTKITDNLTKAELVLKTKDTQKYKFVYVAKNQGGDSYFTVTYSNTLRPLQ